MASARRIRQLVADLNRGGTTIFLTTHYIEEAERLCQRIAFIVKGRIVRTDTIQDLMRRTDGRHVVEFAVSVLFGTTSLLSVTVTFEKKGRSFERLLLAPIPLELLMPAKTAGAILFGVANDPNPDSVLWTRGPGSEHLLCHCTRDSLLRTDVTARLTTESRRHTL